MTSSFSLGSCSTSGAFRTIALACAMTSTAASASPISAATPSVLIDRNITILSFATTANSSVSSSHGGATATFGPCQVSGDAGSLLLSSFWEVDLTAPGDEALGATSCAVQVSFRFSSQDGTSTFHGQYNVDTAVNFLRGEEGVYGWNMGFRGTGSVSGAVSFGESRSLACNRLSPSLDCRNFYDFNPYSIEAQDGEVFDGTLFLNLSADVRFVPEPSSLLLASLSLVGLAYSRGQRRRPTLPARGLD